LEDAQALQKAAQGNFTDIVNIFYRTQHLIKTTEDLYVVHKKYDALYKGTLNLINFSTGGFLNLENNNPVSMSSNLEDHHIFPSDYLKRNWAKVHESLDSEIAIDCVVNRTLIPKFTNIKISNKPPSQYLEEIRKKNKSIDLALNSHMVNSEITSGDYDEMYDFFLNERGNAILNAISTHFVTPRNELIQQFGGHIVPVQ
jgi:hypothetical protein